MDDFLLILGILGLLLVALAAVWLSVVAWRRTMSSTRTLQIWRGMQRRGLEPADAAGEERAFAVAVRRCTMCSSLDECEHWLAGERDDPGSFCPNATFMENLQRAKQRATVKR
jgi:hypothetical protein